MSQISMISVKISAASCTISKAFVFILLGFFLEKSEFKNYFLFLKRIWIFSDFIFILNFKLKFLWKKKYFFNQIIFIHFFFFYSSSDNFYSENPTQRLSSNIGTTIT